METPKCQLLPFYETISENMANLYPNSQLLMYLTVSNGVYKCTLWMFIQMDRWAEYVVYA